MNNPIALAAHGGSLPKAYEKAVEICKQAGFAGVEPSDQFFNLGSEREVSAIRELFQSAGLQFYTYHLPFTADDNIASFYETYRRKAVDRLKESMVRAAAAGARVVIQHPGVCVLDTEVEGIDNYLRALGRSLEALIPHAESLGLVIALENMQPRGGKRFGSQPEHFTLMLKHFGHPHLGFCLDTGHGLLAMHDRLEVLIEAMKPGLRAFHLTDNGGYNDAHLAPGRGLVDWPLVGRVIREIGFDGVACVESPPFAYGPDFSPGAWCQLRADTERLLQAGA